MVRRLELQKIFDICRKFIVSNLDPNDISDYLIIEFLIGKSCSEQLGCKNMTITEQNRIIVDELTTGGPGTLEKFCTILRKNRRHKTLADYLEEGTSLCRH